MFYRKLHIADKTWLYKIGENWGDNILVKSPEGKRFILQRRDVVKAIDCFDVVLYPVQPITPGMVKNAIIKMKLSST